MKFFVGVTDNRWYTHLADLLPDEAVFWQPRDKRPFKILSPYDVFLFKLHSPLDYIAGGGYFVRHSMLPVSLAWEAFQEKTGAGDFQGFLQSILKYRGTDRTVEPDPLIGCIILASPFFFPRADWIPAPEDWNRNIVQGKSYDTSESVGRRLFAQVQERLDNLNYASHEALAVSEDETRYGSGHLIRPRLGQGAFRVIVTDAYHRRCAISGERTLPVLEAVHIRPYAQEGPHHTSNGLLLRKDLHALFDRGYIAVSEDLRIEISSRIKRDFGNGRDYYAYQGRRLVEIPDAPQDRPAKEFLNWHRRNVYLA